MDSFWNKTVAGIIAIHVLERQSPRFRELTDIPDGEPDSGLMELANWIEAPGSQAGLDAALNEIFRDRLFGNASEDLAEARTTLASTCRRLAVAMSDVREPEGSIH